jgi:hypothetical protein
MKKIILIFPLIILLAACGASKSSAFGGHCDVISARIDNAVVEVKASNGSREALRQLASDFNKFESDIIDNRELSLIKGIELNALWLIDYWNDPGKSRVYTVEKVSTDFLEGTLNPMLDACRK